jgi:putative aldouronate transport system substrate-binding protein
LAGLDRALEVFEAGDQGEVQPQPKTTEDLRAVLRAFKTKDPNGNGNADEIPLTGLSTTAEGSLVPYLMDAFLYDPGPARVDIAPLTLKDGRVQFEPMQDGYRTGLEYIASLYAEGLIDEGTFTEDFADLKAKGEVRGAVVVGAVATLHPQNLVDLGQPDGRDKVYDPVLPLTGPEGTAYATYQLPSKPGDMFVITSRVSPTQRIAAVKLLDYLVDTPGHLRAEYGSESVDWVRPRPGDQALDPSLPPLFKVTVWAAGQRQPNDSWRAIAQIYSPTSFRNAQVQPTAIYTKDGYERRLFQATTLYDGKAPKDQVFPLWNIWLDRAEADEVARLQTTLQAYVAENQVEFITGRKGLGAASWGAYLDGLRDLGLQRYLALMQKAYDATR